MRVRGEFRDNPCAPCRTASAGLRNALRRTSDACSVLVNGRTAASVEKAIEAIKGKAAAAAKDDGADAGAAAGTAAAATAAPAAAVAPIAGGELIPLVGTVSTAEGVAAVIAEADKHGEIQILVNNVGIYAVVRCVVLQQLHVHPRSAARRVTFSRWCHRLQKPFEEITDDEWLGYHETNVMSCVRLCRHYLPRMKAANWGRVVLISSEVRSGEERWGWGWGWGWGSSSGGRRELLPRFHQSQLCPSNPACVCCWRNAGGGAPAAAHGRLQCLQGLPGEPRPRPGGADQGHQRDRQLGAAGAHLDG